jgi:hypothetical protein
VLGLPVGNYSIDYLIEIMNKVLNQDNIEIKLNQGSNYVTIKKLNTDDYSVPLTLYTDFNHYQNNYGPMYLFSNIHGHNYLVQKQEKQIWFIVDTSTGYEIDYYDFLSMLNIDMLGISLSEIINNLVEFQILSYKI